MKCIFTTCNHEAVPGKLACNGSNHFIYHRAIVNGEIGRSNPPLDKYRLEGGIPTWQDIYQYPVYWQDLRSLNVDEIDRGYGTRQGTAEVMDYAHLGIAAPSLIVNPI